MMLQNVGNVIRLIIMLTLAFVAGAVILTPAQRTVVIETIQKAGNSAGVPQRTVIQTLPTASVPTVAPVIARVAAPVVVATTAPEPTTVPVPPNSTVGNDPPGCIVTTDYRDGHQFCNDGRGFSDDDPRKQPGYCPVIQVGEWFECENGNYMAAIVNVPVPDAPPPPTALPVAAEADYIISKGCVVAVSGVNSQSRTVCPPDGTTWGAGEFKYIAQRIIEGKYDNYEENVSVSGPKG